MFGCAAQSARARRWLFTASLLCVLLCGARAASAHYASIAYSDVRLQDDRSTVRYALFVRLFEVGPMLGLEDDEPSEELFDQRAQQAYDYARQRITVSSGGESCGAEFKLARVIEGQSLSGSGGTDKYAFISWLLHCPGPVESLAVDYRLFFDIDRAHTGMLNIGFARKDGVIDFDQKSGDTVPLRAGDSRFVWQVSSASGHHFLRFLWVGVQHILYGYDHIAFLIGLLLVASLCRPNNSWELRSTSAALAKTAGIVSLFTIAHTVSLVSASLGLISLSSRIVEPAIALTVMFVCVEDLLPREPVGRAVIIFFFGLIHGLGFAAMLTPLLPASAVVVPLLAFNLGVELGQLGIVVVTVPIVMAVSRALGAPRYHRIAVMPVSALVALLGLVWFIERVFAVRILGF